MKVAEVARRSGIGAHAVRFYVREGLVAPRRDPVNNYKQFGQEHLARLRFIKGAQSLGFSLTEIRELLARMDAGECPCSDMQVQLADKLLETRRHVEELAQRYAFMQRVYEQWGGAVDGRHDLGALCRFLEEQGGAMPALQPVDPRAADRLDNPARRTHQPHGDGDAAPLQRHGKSIAGTAHQPQRARPPSVLNDLLKNPWSFPSSARRAR